MKDSQIVDDMANRLTTREIEILKAAASGHSIKKTADLCRISIATVQTHRHNIIKKLGCGNITNAATTFIRAGVI